MTPLLRLPITALCLVGATLPLVSQAAIFSFDIGGGANDPYSQGAGVFGTASTVWNERARNIPGSVSNFALVDETGAASSVTLSYSRRFGIGVSGVSGTFADLGRSSVTTTGPVVIAGLTAGVSYDLVIYGNTATAGSTLSYLVGSTTQSIVSSLDWSTLTLGTHYTVFQTTADLSGQISFSTASQWTAFQVQPTAVPEPAESAVALGLASLGAVAWLRSRRQPAAKN